MWYRCVQINLLLPTVCPIFAWNMRRKEELSNGAVSPLAANLHDWYARNHRVLPWRGITDAYRIWISEIILQQTRVVQGYEYYNRFVSRFPDVRALAAADDDEVMKLWQGLGYYSRVRNLQKAAKLVCAQYGGQLPADYAALRALPGIGEYTAGAIASISFGLPVPAVDGNVLRVFSRLYNDPGVITEPTVKKAFTARVMEHQPPEKAGDYNQALMELGALVCVPNGAPLCGQCPLAEVCLARAAGTTAQLPQKAKPKPRKIVPVTLALVESPPPCPPQSTSLPTSSGSCPGYSCMFRCRVPRRAMSGQAGKHCAPPTPCPGRSGRISRCCCDTGILPKSTAPKPAHCPNCAPQHLRDVKIRAQRL